MQNRPQISCELFPGKMTNWKSQVWVEPLRRCDADASECRKASRLLCLRCRTRKADMGHLLAVNRLFLIFNGAEGDCWNSSTFGSCSLARGVRLFWPVIFQLLWSWVAGTKAEERGLHLSIQTGLLRWVILWIILWLCGDVVRHNKL